MNLDIQNISEGSDMQVGRSEVPKAANVLSVQLGSLEYAKTFGVDKDYFLNSEFQFQNASFKAYLVERLLAHQINVVNVIQTIEAVSQTYIFNIAATDTQTELIA